MKQRLALLIITANAWGVNTIIPNYENEANVFLPGDVAGYLYDYADWDGQTGWSTQAWVPNGPNFSRMASRGDSALLQIFPTDNRWPMDRATIDQKMADCVWHARVEKGFTYVGVTYQTYQGATPGLFDCASWQHSTFPGNVISHGQWRGTWYQ